MEKSMSPVEDPINLDIPETIETERLLIRPPRPGDGKAMNEAVCESLDHLKRWMAWARHEPSVEEQEARSRRMAAAFKTRSEDIALYIFERKTGRLLGATGIHAIDWSVPRAEIGYWLRVGETGKGYITEAVRAVTDYAFTHFQAERIEIRCEPANKRSAAVAERCGYTLEGQLRNQMRDASGDLRDTLVYGMIRSEWEANQQ
jgi:RimJ/RimL family protein N-acetyltransferase